VVMTPPQLSTAAGWEGAMISSTSRLLLPIDELYVPKEGKVSEETDKVRAFDNGAGSLAARLRDLVEHSARRGDLTQLGGIVQRLLRRPAVLADDESQRLVDESQRLIDESQRPVDRRRNPSHQ